MSLGKVVVVLGASVLLTLTGAAGVLLATADEEELTAATLVERAGTWLSEHDTVAFEGRVRFTDVADEDVSFRFRTEGSVHFERGFRSVERYGFGYVAETLDLGDVVYYREAKATRDLPDAKWGKLDLGAEAERAGVVPFGAPPTPEAGGIAFTPTDLRRVLAALEAPSLDADLDSDDNTVLKGDLDVDAAFGRDAELVERGSLELRATDAGELRRLIVELEQQDGDVRVDLQLSAWGSDVDLEPPAEEDIDPTPHLQEEAIENFTDARLVMPEALPEGWVITFADVLPAADTLEGCRQVELDFDDPDDPTGQYLWLYEMPRSCVELDPPDGAQPLSAGGSVGWYEEQEAEGFVSLIGYVLVGETVIGFDTDLEPGDLATILGAMRPLDFEYEPQVAPGIGRSQGA